MPHIEILLNIILINRVTKSDKTRRLKPQYYQKEETTVHYFLNLAIAIQNGTIPGESGGKLTVWRLAQVEE